MIRKGDRRYKHGLSKCPEYDIWTAMLTRCNNPKSSGYMHYGARGITVCPEWHDFECFLSDMGYRPSKKLTLERIDNDKGYGPDNCKWASSKEQRLNQRPRSIQKNNTSGYTGVKFWAQQKTWKAQICHRSKAFHIGTFRTRREAVIARDKYIIENKLPHRLSPLFTEWVARAMNGETNDS